MVLLLSPFLIDTDKTAQKRRKKNKLEGHERFSELKIRNDVVATIQKELETAMVPQPVGNSNSQLTIAPGSNTLESSGALVQISMMTLKLLMTPNR